MCRHYLIKINVFIKGTEWRQGKAKSRLRLFRCSLSSLLHILFQVRAPPGPSSGVKVMPHHWAWHLASYWLISGQLPKSKRVKKLAPDELNFDPQKMGVRQTEQLFLRCQNWCKFLLHMLFTSLLSCLQCSLPHVGVNHLLWLKHCAGPCGIQRGSKPSSCPRGIFYIIAGESRQRVSPTKQEWTET